MKNKNYVFLFFLFLFYCCDNKEDFPGLPPITTTGENTFGCYVDGVLVTPRDGSGGLYRWRSEGMSLVGGGEKFDELHVRDWKSGTRGVVRIHFEPILESYSEGNHPIEYDNCANTTPYGKPNISLTFRLIDEWYCSIAGTGEVNLLRVDSTNRIVSGTFSCEAVGTDPNKRIKVTKGRFDININTLYETLFP